MRRFGASGYAVGKLGDAPWWAWVGGVGGALFIVAMLYVTDQVGAGTFAAIVTSVA